MCNIKPRPHSPHVLSQGLELEQLISGDSYSHKPDIGNEHPACSRGPSQARTLECNMDLRVQKGVEQRDRELTEKCK